MSGPIADVGMSPAANRVGNHTVATATGKTPVTALTVSNQPLPTVIKAVYLKPSRDRKAFSSCDDVSTIWDFSVSFGITIEYPVVTQ